MKTLEETIEGMTALLLSGECIDLSDVVTSARHYLKEYQASKEALEIDRERFTEACLQHMEAKEKLEAQRIQMMWVDKNFSFEEPNNPLTWDELKTMEGKPVWVEVDYHNPEVTYKYWTIVKYFDSHEGGDMVFTGTGFYCKDLLGVDWQAYRKERK